MIGVKNFRTVEINTIVDPKNAPNVKQFFVSDSDGDPTNIITAQAAAIAGEKCLEQVLVYVTASGTGIKSIQKIAWRNTVWSGSAWDIL